MVRDFARGIEGLRGVPTRANQLANIFGRKTVLFGEQLSTIDGAEKNCIGERQCLGQLFLKNPATHGVRARLDGGPDLSAWPARARSFECQGDGGRMVR